MRNLNSVINVFVVLIFSVRFGNLAKEIESSKIVANSTLIYRTDTETWPRAEEYCSSRQESLLRFKSATPDKYIGDVGLVKRTIHINNDNGSWVGVVTTYEIHDGQDYPVNISADVCVAIYIKSLSVFGGKPYVYGFELKTMNCTATLRAICTSNNFNDNTSVQFEDEERKWTSSCGQFGSLWKPQNHTAIRVARNGTFAVGNFSSTTNEQQLVDSYYWVNLVVKETPSVFPVTGDILRCGYISFYGTGIDYTNCYEEKDFICEADIQENSRLGQTVPVGVYAGLTVTVVVVAAVVVVVVVVCIVRRKNKINETWQSQSKLPEGGRSFTRKHTDNKAQKLAENRITTYNQISLDHDACISIDITNDRVDAINNQYPPAYATIKKIDKKVEKPDVVPRHTKDVKSEIGRPGYLTMDGRDSNPSADKDYDFLESTRSTTSKRYTSIDNGETSENTYSLTSGIDESAYDEAFQRGSSQKRLINEDYDHVVIKGGSDTMNKRTCDSINAETYTTPAQTSHPRSNPAYDKVTIQ